MHRLWQQAIVGALAAALSTSVTAAATAWSVAPEESQILFDYERNGQPAEGQFNRFAGEGTFDRDAPGDATLEIKIESASIDLHDRMASAFATSAEWFDSANYPQVVYRLLKLTPESGGRFHAEGELTIRGRTLPVSTTLSLEIDGASAHATGTLQVRRTDYLLGVGPSALFVDIGPEVAVHFDLKAHPAE